MNIIQTPNKVLNQIAKPVLKVDNKIIKFIEEMKKTLRDSAIGVGLAAPQVGVALRIFIVSEKMPDAKYKEREQIQVFINPEIVSKDNKFSKIKHKAKKNKLEGCLSIQHIWGPIIRADSITLEYTDERNKTFQKVFTGFLAMIIQHEVDHLNGILFTQRVLEQGGKLYRESPENNEMEEIEI